MGCTVMEKKYPCSDWQELMEFNVKFTDASDKICLDIEEDTLIGGWKISPLVFPLQVNEPYLPLLWEACLYHDSQEHTVVYLCALATL